jgi:hypothetical protein
MICTVQFSDLHFVIRHFLEAVAAKRRSDRANNERIEEPIHAAASPPWAASRAEQLTRPRRK